MSTPDRASGRGRSVRATPVAEFARAHALDLRQPERLRAPEAIEAVLALRPGLGVLADYGQIVPATLLAAIPGGMLNLHPSLLPRHRGATPIPAAILAGDPSTGVSLIRMDAGIDSGPIVATPRVALTGSEATPDLEVRLDTVAAGLLTRSIGPWLAGVLPARPQPDQGVSLTRPLRRADGELDPARPAVELERQVRAYQGWPGSFVETPAGRLTVHAVTVLAGLAADVGTIVENGSGLALATVAGALALERVQLAGGRPMSVA